MKRGGSGLTMLTEIWFGLFALAVLLVTAFCVFR